jgi:D-glycero-alpha-D-manno-heptose 1-phosphate guanylyltransferase
LSRCTAAILAGGLGTRLRPALADRPKVLAPVHGRPYLAYVLDRLAAAGIRETVLLTGYQADQVFQALGERHATMKLVHSPEAKPLGTGGALRNALDKLSSPLILLLNGDSWCDVDLADFFKFHQQTGAAVSMVLARVADPARFGKVEIDPDGRVQVFAEKQHGAANWINAGVILIARCLIEETPPGRISLERDLLPRWLDEGKRVFGYRHAGTFLDIGTPESYAQAESLIPRMPRGRQRRSATAPC